MTTRRLRRSVPVAALTALGLAAVPAGASAPLAASHFTGRSAQGRAVDFSVGADGTHVTVSAFGARYRCNRKRYRSAAWRVRGGALRGTTVAGSSFAKTLSTGSSLQSTAAPRLPKGRGRFRFAGRFLAPRVEPGRVTQTATGTLRATFRGPKGLKCTSGPVKWTATATKYRTRTGPIT